MILNHYFLKKAPRENAFCKYYLKLWGVRNIEMFNSLRNSYLKKSGKKKGIKRDNTEIVRGRTKQVQWKT